jgi:hypothetical protein
MSEASVAYGVAKETMPLFIETAKTYAQLSAGALALTITFREKVLGESGRMAMNAWLVASWIGYLVSIGACALYQWVAVRWIEMRYEATFGIIDSRFPLRSYLLNPGKVYGLMIFFFFVASTLLVFSSAKQLLGVRRL